MAEVAEAYEDLEALKERLNIESFWAQTDEIKPSPGRELPVGKWKYYSFSLKQRPRFTLEKFCSFVKGIAEKYDLEILPGDYRAEPGGFKLPFYLAKDGKPIARFYKDTKSRDEADLWGVDVEASRKDIMRDIFNYLNKMKPVD